MKSHLWTLGLFFCFATCFALQNELFDIFQEIADTPREEFDIFKYDRKFHPFLEAFRYRDLFEQMPKRDVQPLSPFGWQNFINSGVGKDIGDLLECQACSAAIQPLINDALNGSTLEELENKAEAICKNLHIMEDPVCEGIPRTFGPWMVHMIGKMGERFDGHLFCGMFLEKNECLNDETNDMVNNWSVDLPPTAKPDFVPPPEPAPDASTVKVLHFTDVHLDLSYLTGSNMNCDMPCCCMESTGLAGPNETAAPYWGNYGGCDMPLRTLEAMFQQVSNDFGGELSYALFTGDAPAHDVWAQSKSTNLDHTTAIINAFKAHFPTLPLYITLGNHEGYPVNIFPTGEVTDPEFSNRWLYDGVGDLIGSYLSPEAVNSFRENGSYSMSIGNGLRIVSLNNNYGASMNMAVWDNFVDPANSLKWLVSELQQAEDSDEKVHIITHHPSDRLLEGYQREFSKIVMRYENIIRAIFVGHTHSDEPLIWINDNGIPSVTTYINPSFTSRHDKMPEFRIFTFDGGYSGATWQLLDIDTYYTPIEDFTDSANPPVFEKLYNTREAFSMTRLLASDWLDLLQRAMNDEALLEQIVRYEDQNYNWEMPEDPLSYLCGKFLYNNEPCPILGPV